MKRLMPFYWPAGPASAVCTQTGKVSLRPWAIRRNKLLMVVTLALMSFGLAKPSCGQTVINCPGGFASTGSCAVVAGGGSGAAHFSVVQDGGGNGLTGSDITLVPVNGGHNGYCVNWQQQVNVQAFKASFTFIPDGYNIAFVLNNSNNNPTFNGAAFCSGAGAEAGFYQAFSQSAPPNNVFALEFDQYSSPDGTAATFTYSTVQIYQPGQQDPGNYNSPLKISTSPVPLNYPASSRGTTTGDVYSATINYDGSTLTLNLYDVTAGGSCPGSSCFTNIWKNVNIPAWVSGNTAWIGLTAGANLQISTADTVDSMMYTVESPGPSPNPPTSLQGSMVP